MQEFGAKFSPMRVGELEVFSVDFGTTGSLAPSETITSAAWSVSPATPGMLPGPSAIDADDPICSTYIRGVSAGQFMVLCTAQTSRGQTLTLPDIGFEQLTIAP